MFDKLHLTISTVLLAAILYLINSSPAVNPPPTTDPNVLIKYRLDGFSARIMTAGLKAEYSKCYQTFLEKVKESKKPAVVEGYIEYVFKILENGQIDSFELMNDSIKDKKLESCVSKQFSSVWFLPPPLGISRYQTYAFNFNLPRNLPNKKTNKKQNKSPHPHTHQ